MPDLEHVPTLQRPPVIGHWALVVHAVVPLLHNPLATGHVAAVWQVA